MMENTRYNYLRFARFKGLENWSVQYTLNNRLDFNKKYSQVKIGSLLKRNKTIVTIKDDILYKRVSIKTNNGGCHLRDEILGKSIGTKTQYRITAGQFIISKIDARNGAMGVVPIDCNNAVITSNFWTYDVNQSIVNPIFLALITTTKRFAAFAENVSNGSTNRHYLQESLFLNARIPLPSFSEQNKLILSYNNKIKLALNLDTQAAQINQNIESYLLNSLGISLQEKMPNGKISECRFLKFVRFKDINRWDVAYYSQKKNIGGKYKTYTLNDCIENFMQDEHGYSLRIETYKNPEKSFQYIGMEDVEKGSGHLIQNKCIHGKDVKSQTLCVPLHYFLYGKLRPYLNKYWFNDTGCDNIVCSSEFFVFSIKDNINKDYFRYYLSSSAVQHQIQNMYQGARMPRINEETFKSIQIPIPPKNIQESIVKHINGQKAQIKQLKQQAESLRKAALIEFEKEIFEQ